MSKTKKTAGPSDAKIEQGIHQGPHKNLASLDFYIPWVLLIRFACVPQVFIFSGSSCLNNRLCHILPKGDMVFCLTYCYNYIHENKRSCPWRKGYY